MHQTMSPLAQSDLAARDKIYHAFVEYLSVCWRQEGPLKGLTFAAKDMFVFEDRQPYCGLEHPPALGLQGTASVLREVLDRGATFRGFTTLTALAYEPSGLNGNGSRPVNPWGQQWITGGSSSGSAVAVAAGLVDFAIGSDTAGSLRIPAQACGVASYKPSFGQLPLTGAMPLAPSLDCVGFLARHIEILSKIADVFVSHSSDDTGIAFLMSDCEPLCDADIVTVSYTHLTLPMILLV